MSSLVSNIVLEEMSRYNSKFDSEMFREMEEETAHSIFRVWYDNNLPVDLITWSRVNHPDYKMLFKNGYEHQINFINKNINSIFYEDYDERQKNPVKVINSHISKSIKLPVYEIDVKRIGLKLILRDNFHDWKVSVITEKPVDIDFNGLFEEGLEISKVYCEGFKEEQVFSSFKNNKNSFTIELNDDYKLYTFVYLLNKYLTELQGEFAWK